MRHLHILAHSARSQALVRWPMCGALAGFGGAIK